MKWLALLGVLGGCDLIFRVDHVSLAPDAAPDAPPVIAGRWIDVATGNTHTCALDEAHHLFCWGSNIAGEAGIAATVSQTAMTAIGDATWTSIRASYLTTCGIQTDGSLWCWGLNSNGQVGDGTTTDVTAPAKVADPSWLAVAPGIFHTCAIRDDHSLWCWGKNDKGQLGNASTMDSPTFVPAAASITFDEVAVGTDFTCGLATGGAVWCWGANDYGQLANGTTSTAPGPQPQLIASSETWAHIAAAANYACAITTAGQLRCWGIDNFGQLGDASKTNRSQPRPVLVNATDATNWVRVAASPIDACAVNADGAAYCWGSSIYGQLAIDTGGLVAPTALPAGPAPWTSVVVGTTHTCALAQDHTLWCVGGDSFGQLGDVGSSSLVPVQVAGTYKAVSTGIAHTCAIDTSNTLWCAGDNGSQQLGVGDSTPRKSFVSVGTFATVSAGQSQTCATTAANSVACWGGNYRGQLGTGNMNYYATPQAIRPGNQIDTGFLHTCTVDPTSTTVYCWGRASEGQIGNKSNATPSVVSPFQIPAQTWKRVAAGFTHSCGISTSGNIVRCWGTNSSGQLGVGNLVDDYDPAAVTTTGVVADQLVAGAYSTCAINDTTHAMTCWGANYAGQLGLGDNGVRSSPTSVPGSWSQVALGWEHSCAVRMDGTLWCTGKNNRGQLGIGNRTIQFGYTQVGTDTDWTNVAVRDSHSCALKLDQSLWCWGDNTSGQLATGDAWRTALRQVP